MHIPRYSPHPTVYKMSVDTVTGEYATKFTVVRLDYDDEYDTYRPVDTMVMESQDSEVTADTLLDINSILHQGIEQNGTTRVYHRAVSLMNEMFTMKNSGMSIESQIDVINHHLSGHNWNLSIKKLDMLDKSLDGDRYTYTENTKFLITTSILVGALVGLGVAHGTVVYAHRKR